jgi:hypothetical protein
MATPQLLERFDAGQILQPMDSGHGARTDAMAFGPNLTIRYGQAVARQTANGLGYPYSSATLTTPAAPTGTPNTTGGTLAAGTYYYKLESLYGSGNSAAVETASITTTAATSSITLSWTGTAGATGYNLYRTAMNGSSGSETFLVTVPPPQTSTLGTVTYTDTGAIALGTATAPSVSSAPSDGTQTCIGVSEYSFVTDANGMAYIIFSTTPGSPAVAVPSVRDSGRSTMSYFYRGDFDPRDLVGLDATAQTALGARALGSGVLHIP